QEPPRQPRPTSPPITPPVTRPPRNPPPKPPFFFQAEDGIRDYKVTGVRTCALPIWCNRDGRAYTANVAGPAALLVAKLHKLGEQIGRASCRERAEIVAGRGSCVRGRGCR